MSVSALATKGPFDYGNPATETGNHVLMHWGFIEFQVFPLNIHEFQHLSETDWAQKEIAGAAIYREWVGENDEVLHLHGRLFPYKIGGLTQLELFEAKRRAGIADNLIGGGSGQGHVFGWFVCHRLSRAHTFLSSEGWGQQIAFEAEMIRVPMPSDADLYAQQLFQTAGIP